MNELKDSEKRVLEYMKQVIDEKGYPPTVREIGEALGIKSTSSVHKTLTQLEKKGYIKKDIAKPRALTLVKQGEDEEPEKIESLKQERIDIVDIPVVGQIAAGTPILAEQNIEESFPIPSRFVSRKTNFMLVVKATA